MARASQGVTKSASRVFLSRSVVIRDVILAGRPASGAMATPPVIMLTRRSEDLEHSNQAAHLLRGDTGLMRR